MSQDRLAILGSQLILSQLYDRVQGTGSVDKDFVLEELGKALEYLTPRVKEYEIQRRLMEF